MQNAKKFRVCLYLPTGKPGEVKRVVLAKGFEGEAAGRTYITTAFPDAVEYEGKWHSIIGYNKSSYIKLE